MDKRLWHRLNRMDHASYVPPALHYFDGRARGTIRDGKRSECDGMACDAEVAARSRMSEKLREAENTPFCLYCPA